MIAEQLGLIRTNLANERTLLAYARTALAFAASGVGMVHFFISFIAQATGWLLLTLGVGFFFVGIWRFVQVKRRTGKLFS
jgi:putative membrane protein